MLNPLKVCITYDDNFEPLCANLCSALRIEGIQVRLNKTESENDYALGFQSKNWYMNLSEKIKFLRKNINQIKNGEVICVSDADIQFFKPKNLLKLKYIMDKSNIDYIGQREGESHFFNGGFFLIKKNYKTLSMIDQVINEDLKKYYHAEQEVINNLIQELNIKAVKLSKFQYVSGCFVDKLNIRHKNKIVMHHATCCHNYFEKKEQMNFLRSKFNFEKIDWKNFEND